MVFSHPACHHLLQQPQETGAGRASLPPEVWGQIWSLLLASGGSLKRKKETRSCRHQDLTQRHEKSWVTQTRRRGSALQGPALLQTSHLCWLGAAAARSRALRCCRRRTCAGSDPPFAGRQHTESTEEHAGQVQPKPKPCFVHAVGIEFWFLSWIQKGGENVFNLIYRTDFSWF